MRTAFTPPPRRESGIRAAFRGAAAVCCLMGSVGLTDASPAERGASAVAPGAAGSSEGLITLRDLFAGGSFPGAGPARSERVEFAPGELIVRLRPEAGGRVRSGRAGGLASALPGDTAAAELDELLRRHQAQGMRRVFRVYEDAAGRQVDTAGARLRRSREVHQKRGRRRLPPLPARTPDLENFFLVEMPGLVTSEEMEAAMAELVANDLVVSVQPNFIHRILAEPLPAVSTVTDDRYVTTDGVSWSEGSFANAFPDLYGVRNLHVLEAWSLLDSDGNGVFGAGETAPGEGVVVAVIDTGLDSTHPEIAGSLFVNPGEIPADGVDNDANGLVDDVSGWDFVAGDSVPEDLYGHGTHVAGTIAAVANNAEGIVGVAPFARILPLKGLNDWGAGTSAGLAAAVHYAALVGAHITSNSWGSPFVDELLRSAFEYAEAGGVLSFAAAGNEGLSQVAIPAFFPGVVAVAAVDDGDVLAPFSNWGEGLDLCAPGVGVLSLSANDHDNLLADVTGHTVGDRYLWLDGTSMAVPHASGAAALLMSLHPAESAAEIRGRLMEGAVPIASLNPGREGGLGAGRVDALSSALAAPVSLLRVVAVRPDPIVAGEPAAIDVELKNFWAPAAGVHASLTSVDPDLTIVDGERDFGDLATGEMASRTFDVEIAPGVAPGQEIELLLTITADGEPAREHAFSVRVGFFANRDHLADMGPFPLFVVGATFGDFDADGLQDMGIGTVAATHLYRQRPDGTFEDREPNGSGFGRFPIFADMNNDGLLDMLATGFFNSSGVVLSINVGGGQFEVLPESSGFAFPKGSRIRGITPIDLDADGDLDLVAGLDAFYRDEQGVSRNIVVLRNEGDLTFSDAWAETGIGRAMGSLQYVTLDWDGDGFQDLLGMNWSRHRLALHRNLGKGRFEDVTEIAFPVDSLTCEGIPGIVCAAPTSVAAGDYDNDGDTDLLLTRLENISVEEGSAMVLLANDGTGVYADVTDRAGDLATLPLLSGWWGTSFFDLENDGDLDILVPIDFLLGGTPAREPARTVLILRNDGDGRFTNVSDIVWPPDTPLASMVTAVGDYDGDGGQDILAPVGRFVGREVGGLMNNLAGRGRAWLEIELIPVESPPHGYGARVTAVADGRVHTREVHYSPVETWRVHFGLGDAAIVDLLEVRWPSGIVGIQRNVAVGRRLEVYEGTPCPDLPDGECPTVAIDIDVESDANLVNLTGRGILSVAILGSDGLDTAAVDATRVFFGPGRISTPEHKNGPHVDDVNADGWPDLLFHYRIQETGIEAGDVEACLRGQMLDRTPFSGCDRITVKGPRPPR